MRGISGPFFTPGTNRKDLPALRAFWQVFSICALERIRTFDTQLRKLVLYPLSYEGNSEYSLHTVKLRPDYSIRNPAPQHKPITVGTKTSAPKG